MSAGFVSAGLVNKVRFAPSPTGFLHVGNARLAVANHLFALRYGATFLLRIDDTDRERSREEFATGIGHDLRWLGIEWGETFRQSDRLDRYAEAAEQLKRSGRLYPCFETEEELNAKREMRLRRHEPPVYDRAMLKLTADQRARAEANGKQPYWRFRLTDAPVGWVDGVGGRREVKLPAVSDPVLIRADGTPLYTFTSVVDDADSAVTHVIRGEDHVTNTGVQIDIARALNAAVPSFAHLPLLLDAEGGKLSKRAGSVSLRALRADGIEPMAVAAFLARIGTSDDPAPLPWGELARTFDLRRYGKGQARFDGSQLLSLNRRVLHDLPFEAVQDRLPAAATPAFWAAVRGNLDMLTEARGWWDVVAGTIVPPHLPDEAGFLREALDILPAEPWGEDVWTAWTGALKQSTGRKGKALFMPLRQALTGEEHGPELRQLLPLIGRPRAEARLREAAS